MQAERMDSANRTYHHAQSHMELLPNYYRWMYSGLRPYLGGVVIELGCGVGLGIATYLRQVERVYAVDHDLELLRQFKARLPPNKVTASAADLLGDRSEHSGISADLVNLMDVLEHFADDTCVLVKAARLVRQGGHLAVKVPAQRRLFSAMDEASGHYRRYDRDDFVRVVESPRLRRSRFATSIWWVVWSTASKTGPTRISQGPFQRMSCG